MTSSCFTKKCSSTIPCYLDNSAMRQPFWSLSQFSQFLVLVVFQLSTRCCIPGLYLAGDDTAWKRSSRYVCSITIEIQTFYLGKSCFDKAIWIILDTDKTGEWENFYMHTSMSLEHYDQLILIKRPAMCNEFSCHYVFISEWSIAAAAHTVCITGSAMDSLIDMP